MYQPYQSTWVNPYLNQSQYTPSVPQNYMQPVNGIIQVNGAQSALQYQLPPNSMSPALFDTSGTCFYVVSTDGTGTKTIECYDFTPHVEPQQETNNTQYVSRDEFNAFVQKVSDMIGAANGPDGSVQTTAEQSFGNAGNGQGQPASPNVNPHAVG